jgi:hypothetical protein
LAVQPNIFLNEYLDPIQDSAGESFSYNPRVEYEDTAGLLESVLQKAKQVVDSANKQYKEIDKAAGGWLPGGGVASPLTQIVFPSQPFPKRTEELSRTTGVKARFIDPEKTPSLVRQIAPFVAPSWGTQHYANPILNEIGMNNYSGGKTKQEKQVEFHELGHLNPTDKNIYSYLGVLGRSLQGVSNQVGNLPLVDLAAGLALQHTDAPEEDRAEKFAKKYAERENYFPPVIYENNTSDYGNMLRREGRELTSDALNRLANPFGLVSRTTQAINEKRAEPIRKEVLQIEPKLKRLLETEIGDQISPELINLSKRHHELLNQLEKLKGR